MHGWGAGVDLLDIAEIVGVAAFAASGAIVAIEKKLDVFGILVLATVTAVGGGVIRDVVMYRGILTFFYNYSYAAAILISAGAVMALRGHIRWGFPFVVIDALGLSVFTIVAGVKAMDTPGVNFLAFAFVSVITGIGGSLMRDIMVREIPTILRKEIYATAVLLGAMVLWFARPALGNMAVYVAMAVVFFARVVSFRLNVHLNFGAAADC